MATKLTTIGVHDLRLPYPWRQGEHVCITGDTGSGKTTLAASLILSRRWTIALRSKGDDVTLPGRVIRTAKAFRDRRDDEQRFVLYPEYRRQLREFWLACEQVWKEGAWCVYFDELFYLSRLGLTPMVEMLLTQGRSRGISVVTGMQRPVHVTRFAMSQATHNIAFGSEGRDIRVLADVGSTAWADAVASLGRYQFAWYYRPERSVWVGSIQDLI